MCARADIPHLRSKMFNYPSGLASRIPCLLDVAASKLLFDAVMSVGQKTLEALQVPPRIRDSLATNSALPLLALAFALQAPRNCQSRCPRPHRAMLRTESLGRLSRRASSFYITEERLPPPSSFNQLPSSFGIRPCDPSPALCRLGAVRLAECSHAYSRPPRWKR